MKRVRNVWDYLISLVLAGFLTLFWCGMLSLFHWELQTFSMPFFLGSFLGFLMLSGKEVANE